jgi:hypothetical protein
MADSSRTTVVARLCSSECDACPSPSHSATVTLALIDGCTNVPRTRSASASDNQRLASAFVGNVLGARRPSGSRAW